MASNGNVILWCASSAMKRSIRHFLTENAYTVVSCEHAEDVRIALSIDDYCLLVTDTPYPDEALEQLLRRNPGLPVFHITARLPEVLPPAPHFLYSLPFDLDEIGRLLRGNGSRSERLPLGKYEILPGKSAIRFRNTETNIPKKEMELLLLLYRNRPDVVSREQIARKLWPAAPSDRDSSINVYINNLRKYFSEDAGIAFLSVYGKGLRLESE